MKKLLFTIAGLTIITTNTLAQNLGRMSPNAINYGANQSISLSYSLLNQQNNPSFSANLNSSNDLLNGTAYNNGNAINYTVASKVPYMIRIYAQSSSYMSSFGNSVGGDRDIRNFIYCKVVDNTTGGVITENEAGYGTILGTTEKTIISGCQPNRNVRGVEQDGTFSLIFKAKPGYSMPPGTYTTNILVTATYE